jgi:DNA polymerase type B, organellar and viral
MFMFQIEELAVNRGNANISTVTYHVLEGAVVDDMGAMLPAILRPFDDDPDLADLHDSLLESLDGLVEQAQGALDARGRDSLGVGIYGQDQQGQDVRIYVPLRQWDLLDGQTILDAIDSVLNSAQSLLLDFEIRFTVVHRELPAVQGAVLGRSVFKGDLRSFIRGKRGIVIIHPPEDPYQLECCWQFCVLGLARCLQEGTLTTDQFEPLGLSWTSDLYKKCTSGQTRFEKRHVAAVELLQCIRNHEPYVQHQPLEIIHYVETLFQVHIVLYNFKNKFARLYPYSEQLPYAVARPTFYGLLTEEGEVSHLDYVSIPSSLCTDVKGVRRICQYCFTTYARSRSCGVDDCKENLLDRCLFCHSCSGLCNGCMTQECGWGKTHQDQSVEQRPFQRFKPSCDDCKRAFYSPKCQQLHGLVCDKIINKRCEECGKPDHRSLKCDETYCMMCSEKYCKDDEHNCYLRPVKLKEPATNYWAYDFETCTDENKRHVLYLCTAWPLYPVPGLELLAAKYDTRPTRFPGQPVFVFWGLEGSLTFFDFLMDPALQGGHFFAHNGGRYDTIFIEYYMTIKKGLIANKIQRGLNELQLVFPQLKLHFKDSRNFINTALRNMSGDFGIDEMKKGHFPHSLITVEWMQQSELVNFHVERPARQYFQSEFAPGQKGLREQAELETFLEEFYAQPGAWNMKEDAIQYCISDTLLLGETLRLFREDTMEMTEGVVRPDHVDKVVLDPLLHVTLPSAVMKFYLSQMLPRKTISIIDRYPALQRVDEEKWLLWLEHSQNITIERESMFTECFISGRRTTPQGHLVLYRFLSCYEYGCTDCYRPSAWNVRRGKIFQHCWNQLTQETAKIRSHQHGTTRIVDCWTHHWFQLVDKVEFKRWLVDSSEFIESHTPMDPREAYKGGISELYKLHVPGQIQMVDFVSQYPTSMLGESTNPYNPAEQLTYGMPTGTYNRIVHPVDYKVDKEVLGVIKCTLECPSNLYAPFLGYKVPSRICSQSYEVLYGTCRLCMELRCVQCTHSLEERVFTGTWTLVEIDYALSLGYKIHNVLEVWEYEHNNTELFKEFMVPFIVWKTCCKRSGLVENDEFTPKGAQTAQWLESLTHKPCTPTDFVNAPSKRNVAKLIMNSFYGKWGQRSQWSETQSFKEEDSAACMKLFGNVALHIRYCEVIHQHIELGPVVYVDYEHRLPAVKGCSQKNDHIAAHITAYGRIMINTLVQQLGRHSIYTDTDSLFHQHLEQPPYVPGFRIGDLELELPDAHTWTGCGRKWYSYRMPNGSHVAKQKGVALKSSSHPLFAPEAMLQLMRRTVQVHSNLQAQGVDTETSFQLMKKGKVEVPMIGIPQTTFKTVQESKLCAYKKSIVMNKNTTFLLWSMKRVPCWEVTEDGVLDTLPYGYKE